MTLNVSAFQFRTEGIFRHALTGETLPDSFEGHCMVYYDDGPGVIFATGINEEGERYWSAIGNKPKINVVWT